MCTPESRNGPGRDLDLKLKAGPGASSVSPTHGQTFQLPKEAPQPTDLAHGVFRTPSPWPLEKRNPEAWLSAEQQEQNMALGYFLQEARSASPSCRYGPAKRETRIRPRIHTSYHFLHGSRGLMVPRKAIVLQLPACKFSKKMRTTQGKRNPGALSFHGEKSRWNPTWWNPKCHRAYKKLKGGPCYFLSFLYFCHCLSDYSSFLERCYKDLFHRE